MDENENYKDILIVPVEGQDYVVAAPAFESELGDLVEFRASDHMTLLGPVTEKMTCRKFDEAWSCFSRLAKIHEAVAIYNAKWSTDSIET